MPTETSPATKTQPHPTRTKPAAKNTSTTKPLVNINVPVGDYWDNQSMIVISALAGDGSEVPVDPGQLNIIQQPVNIRKSSIANLLSGQHRTCRIREATIEPMRIVLDLVWKRENSNYIDSGDGRKIIFRVANGQQLKLFIAAVNVEADGRCDDFVICNLDGRDARRRIAILESTCKF